MNLFRRRKPIDAHRARWCGGAVVYWCFAVEVLLIIGVGGVGGVAKADADLEAITVYHTGRFGFGASGVFMAIENGYYTEEGLSVDVQYGESDEAAILNRIKGQEGVYGNSASAWGLREHMSGEDFVAFGSAFQATNVGLLVNPNAGIKSPADLKGRRVMMPLDYLSVEVRAMILKSGLREDQFELINKKGRVNQMLDGEADAVLVRHNPQTIKELSKAEASWKMLMPSCYGVRFYWNVMVASRVEADRHPQRIAAFYRATIRGYQYAWTHPTETIDRYLEQEVIDPSQWVETRNRLEKQALTILRGIDVDNLGKMDPARWREMADTFVALGEADPVASLDRFLFDPDPEPNLAWVGWVGGSTVGVTLLAFGLAGWNRQLSGRVRQGAKFLVRSEQRRALMKQELDHRVKNNLASVLSLSNQTLKAVDSLAAFKETFSGRLKVMVNSHESLATDAWSGIDLRHAAELALEPFLAGDAGKAVAVSNPEVRLPSQASIPLSMALHELSTNAAKYGALSDQATGGRVDLSWELGDDKTLTIRWVESGGPAIEGPIEPGVGTLLIKDLLEYNLSGHVELLYHREGLRCTIQFPMTANDWEERVGGVEKVSEAGIPWEAETYP